jgi:hypothetical protein
VLSDVVSKTAGSRVKTVTHDTCRLICALKVKFSVLWDILPCSQIDVDRHQGDDGDSTTSETSVDIDLTTRQYIPED